MLGMIGKLIVIDGADGAGKATQARLLTERLLRDGYEVETLDFPQYTENTFGKLLRRCLDGQHGDFIAVDPRIASTLYAADRFESSPHVRGWLEAGKVVILDRYVSSNMMHQGAKLAGTDEQELDDFLTWLDHIEHEVFGIPRPDQIIYLDVPHTVRAALKAQAVAEGKHGVAADVHEQNLDFQRKSEERARQIVARTNNWHQVSCCEGDALRSREAIHDDVFAVVSKLLA